MLGDTISHYRLLEKLGSGGMGVVYAAEDLKLGRKVALKFLSSHYSRDHVALARFEREARAASALNHPNICTIYEIDEFDGQRFMAMELLKGMTLKDWILHKVMPLDELLDFACQVLAGIEAAHAEGIIHRDIKPANIFVTTHGYLKLLDFGLAKLGAEHRGAMETAAGTTMAAELVAREDLTMPGSAMGTVAYMSPEQALGEPLDARTDLFSFGAVLYQMATGRLPFAGNTSIGTIDAILHKVPSPVTSLNPGMPPELQSVVIKALEKDLHLRYQSAKDLRVDLQRIRRDAQSSPSAITADSASRGKLIRLAPPSSKPDTVLGELPARKRAHRSLAYGSALLVILVLAGLAAWWRIAARAASPAHLTIHAPAGAQILIDGKPSSSVGTDGTALLPIAPGEHLLQLNLQNYQPYSTSIVVKGGESRGLTAALKAVPPPPAAPPAIATGKLAVTSNVVGADILVDGQLKGFTASGNLTSLDLDEGAHKVQLKKAGYKDSAEQDVEIHARQQDQLSFKLEKSNEAAAAPPVAYLIIRSNPGAEIRVDEAVSGIVDNNGILPVKVTPGEHLVEASLSGHEPFSTNVTLKTAGKTYLVAELKASPPSVVTFTAKEPKITAGQASTLNWITQNATEVRIEPGVGLVPSEGSRDVSPMKATTYVLTAKGNGGSASGKTSIAVDPDPEDAQGINETLARFKGAYDSMDIHGLQLEWPSLTQTQADAMKTTFLGLTSVRLNDDCSGSPVISGDSAQWSCTETISYFIKGARQIPDARNTVVFHFKREGKKWYVVRRERAH